MKQIKISNIPERLALMVVLLFGLLPAVGFTIYHYQGMSRAITDGEAWALETLRQELKKEVDSDIVLFNSYTAMGRTRMRQAVRTTSETVTDVMRHMYLRHADTLPPNALSDLIRDHFRGIRLFGGRGHVFAYTLDGTLQLYPPNMDLEGAKWFNLEEINGKKPVQEMIEMVKNQGEGFVEYHWPHTEKGEMGRTKIAYVRLFPPLGWVVGTGDYTEAMARDIQAFVLEGKKQRNLEGNGDFFIFDREMRQLSGRPDAPALSKKYLKQALTEDTHGITDENGRFIDFSIPSGSGDVAMMGYARHYPPWGWTIGKIVDGRILRQRVNVMQTKAKQEIMNDLAVVLSVNGLALVFVFLAGRLYSTRLEKNLVAFESFFGKAGKRLEQIDLNRVQFHELKILGKMANAMVSQREKVQQAVGQMNIKLKEANQQLEEMANLDGLTHIANRRFFDTTLEKEWKRALREGQPITLGMLDIDFFKQYNDTYGHQQGDACLVSIAAGLKEVARRPGDLAARYGGEEFVILLPNTDLSGGQKVGEELRRKVAAMEIPHSQSPLGRVSFSMGLSSATPGQGLDASDLVTQADQALYLAKEKGRDRIEIRSGRGA